MAAGIKTRRWNKFIIYNTPSSTVWIIFPRRSWREVTPTEGLTQWKIHVIANCTHPWQQGRNTSEQNALFAQVTFTHSLMVPVDASKFDYSSLTLLDFEVKINEICYCSLLLPQQLLTVIRQVAGKFRNSAPVYRSRWFSDINISQGSVATRLCSGRILNKVLLHISLRLYQWKDF